jgi:predicted MPP superfamily phosphohydrolase
MLGAMTRARRRWLGVGALVAGALGLLAWARLLEPRWIEVTTTRVPVAGLGADLAGLRIAFLTDTHYGPYTDAAFLARAVRRALAEHPDVVLLGGDYVQGWHPDPAAATRPFAALRAPLGVYAVLGNHDHWAGAARTRAGLRRAGVTVLENEHRLVARGDARLALVGVGDLWEGSPDPHRALRGVPAEVPRVVVTHNPDLVAGLDAGLRVDLVLAGHTHGGQVRLPVVGAPVLPAARRYAAGLVPGPPCPVYVSRGLGVITPPVRLGCRPEVTIIVLVPARPAGPRGT